MYSALQNEYPNVFVNSKPPKARLPNCIFYVLRAHLLLDQPLNVLFMSIHI